MPNYVFHDQVTVGGVAVDEGIAPLLKVLWDKGYDTQFSCQGGGGHKAYILFNLFGHAQSFHSATASLLVGTVPNYFNQSVQERGQSLPPVNILNHARLALYHADPMNAGDVIRGTVEFNPFALQQITKLWENA